MKHHFSNHSFLASCEHDKDLNVMHITFTNGKTYSYGDCSHNDFEAFKNAESAGKHYAKIKASKGMYQPWRKEIAEEIAFELIERYTKDQRRGYRYPDDFNGDTIDRANDCANKIIEVIKAELDK